MTTSQPPTGDLAQQVSGNTVDSHAETVFTQGMTTNTAPATSYESFLTAAKQSIWNKGDRAWFTPEAVAQRAYEQQSCIWHAATSIALEHLDESGYGTCHICGGVTAPNQNNAHGLCTVRQEMGHDIERLNNLPTCDCARCKPGTSLYGKAS